MQMNFHQSTHKTSGRIEVRMCWVVTDPVAFDYIRHYAGWPDLNSIIRVERERRDGGTVTRDTAYYIRSLTAGAATILDVTFNEDDSRIRSGESAKNMAVLHAVALNLLKHNPAKASLRQKRF